MLKEHDLKEYLFASIPSRIPCFEETGEFWFGVEHEFIVHKAGNSKALQSEQEYRKFSETLCQKHGYTQRSADPTGLSISRETDTGYIVIKPDFAFHIVEIAFPPHSKFKSLLVEISGTLGVIDSVLAAAGLERSRSSIIESPQLEFGLVPLPRLSNYLDQFPKRDLSSRKYYYPEYPAFIAATQIHLNIASQNTLNILPSLFMGEFVAANLFSKGGHFNGSPDKYARQWMYEHSLGPGYKLKTVPEKVSQNLAELCSSYSQSDHYFLNDPFYPVRDLSFIRLRPFGTVEFRSACSQYDISDFAKLLGFRLAQFLVARNAEIRSVANDSSIQRSLWLKTISNSDFSPAERKIAQNYIRSVNESLEKLQHIVPHGYLDSMRVA